MPRQRAESELRHMLGVMRYESFYSTRTWIDDELGVYVGWTARAGSFSDAGPQQNETGDVVLMFSGEEYPAGDTIQRLKERGHRIDEAQSSYIVHLYEEDPSFPAGLNGLFHGVLVDRRRRRVVLFNDRYGMHRLYFHESKDAVYFAAEAKAILAVRPELRRIDLRGLGESLTLGCVLENRTIFDGIHVLPGASLWVFENGQPHRKTTYFEPREWEDQSLLDSDEFYRKTRDVFARNLPRYFNGSARIGISLTGGLDSRIIMAWQKCPAGSLPAYTWGGMYRECQDVIVAREVARTCGQSHEVIVLGKEFLSRFPHYADRAVFLTDGCVDVSAAADVYMNEQARAIAPVRMTGLYGGEVLRRVRMFKPVFPMAGLFRPELIPQFEQARRTYEGVVQGHPLSFGAFRQAPWYHYSNLSLEQSQITMRLPFLDNEFVKTVFQAPQSVSTTCDVSLRLIVDGKPALGRIPTDRGLGGRGMLAATVAHAVKEFSFKAEYAYDYGMPQWLARIDHLLAPFHLERLFLGRHKPLHFRMWYRDQLSGYVREMLLDPRSLSRPYVERKMVEHMVSAHVQGSRNYTTEIHKMLKLELLHRNFIDGPMAAVSSFSPSLIAYA
jgi:asparagine synthase (glutamine-hydrolysing)